MPTVNSANATGSDAGGTTISISCPTAGADVALAVGVGSASGDPQLTSSVTHNGSGTGWAELFDALGASGVYHTSGHCKVAPDASGTLLATLAGADDELTLSYAVLNGVHQGSPVGTVPSVASADTVTTSITIPSAAGDLCLAFPVTGFNGLTPGAGETQEAEAIVGGATTAGIFSEVAGGASTTIAPTRTAAGFTDGWVTCGVAFKPAVAASAALTGTVTASITEADIV